MRSLLTPTVNTLILHCCTIQNDEDGDEDDDDDDVDVHAMLCNGFVVAATTAMPPSRQRERESGCWSIPSYCSTVSATTN